VIETIVRWSGDMEFTGVSGSGYQVLMDTIPKFGGKGKGPTPMQLVLIALGGCTGMDVVSILKKMGVEISGLEIKLRGERKMEHPKAYKEIEIKYIFKGKDIAEEKVKKAITLSQEKYCSVSTMLAKGCEIRYSYEIV